MSDMFNQSASTSGQQHSQPHGCEVPPGRPAPQPAQGSPVSAASTPAMAERVQSPDVEPAASPLASDDASPNEHTATSSAAHPVVQHASLTPPTPPYTMFGIEIRPDASAADLDRLASKLGRHKTNGAAEDLTRKWSDYIDGLRSRRVPFDKILNVMLAGEDQDAFREEFTENQQVTDKTLRKFRTLVGSTRADDNVCKRANERAF